MDENKKKQLDQMLQALLARERKAQADAPPPAPTPATPVIRGARVIRRRKGRPDEQVA